LVRKAKTRKPIPDFGIKGRAGKRGRMVRGFLELGLARVQWSEEGRRRTASWPDTPENRARAIAFGEGVVDRLNAGESPRAAEAPPPVTLRQLWEKFYKAEVAPLRVRSRDNYLKRWQKFERFKGRDFVAQRVTREHLDDFRAEMQKLDHAINQVQRHVQMVRSVFRWAVDNDHIPPSKVVSYRFKKNRDDKPMEVPEYSPDEAQRILAQFDPRDSRDWRGYVATFIFAFAGPRQNAARHLTWDDVDFDLGQVRWRPELDKLAKDRKQPVPLPVLDALYVAYGWRIAFGYEGPFILFRPGAGVRDLSNGRARSARAAKRSAAKVDKPWTYSAYNTRLRAAEAAAKVPHIRYRAAHGFRRFVVTEALKRTGNLVLAGQYIGDSDIRTLQRSYVRERAEDVRSVADHMAATGQDFEQKRNATAMGADDSAPPEPATLSKPC
jgi:integrase